MSSTDMSNSLLAEGLRRLTLDGAGVESFRIQLRDQIVMQAARGCTRGTDRPRPSISHIEQRKTRKSGWRGPLVSVGTAAALTVGGFLGYLRLQPATPVSAAQVLHRAAAALTAADSNQVIHEVASVHAAVASGSRVSSDALGLSQAAGHLVPDARVDEWTQLSADGTVYRQDVTVTDSATGELLSHRVVTAHDMFDYEAAIKGTTVTNGGAGTWRRVLSSSQPITMLNLESGGQAGLLQLFNEAQRGGAASYLGEQTSHGVAVKVIRLSQPLHTYTSPDSNVGQVPSQLIFTLFINAQTYMVDRVLAEADSAAGDPLSTTTLSVAKHEILPLTAARASTFTFTSPPGACVLTVNASDPAGSTQSGTCSGAMRP